MPPGGVGGADAGPEGTDEGISEVVDVANSPSVAELVSAPEASTLASGCSSAASTGSSELVAASLVAGTSAAASQSELLQLRLQAQNQQLCHLLLRARHSWRFGGSGVFNLTVLSSSAPTLFSAITRASALTGGYDAGGTAVRTSFTVVAIQ